MSRIHTPERRIPTRTEALIFRMKTFLLQFRRFVQDRTSLHVSRFGKTKDLIESSVIAESRTPLWTESEPEERSLVAGKIQNLRLAVRELDGIVVPSGEVFSFWKHIGRASRVRGFVEGRELREGCIIPNVGGGLCQISNALYDASLKAGYEIVERHAHTQVIAGSLAEKGRDATIFWNYVDLRFRSPKPFRIEASLDHENLTVRFRGEKTANGNGLHRITRKAVHSDQPASCATCEMNDCHRVVTKPSDANFGSTAFLVDDVWPEFDTYIQNTRTDKDTLFLPMDGRRFRKANYAWTAHGFGRIKQSIATTAIRSYRSRKLAAQGAERQRNLLAMYEKLAESYAKRLTYDCLHVVVQQNLLPFLWRNGHLGGRTFDVLMTALPMNELQRTLDAAHKLHPESRTLADFRADQSLLDTETEALSYAHRIITPHMAIAKLFPDKAELIRWKLPDAVKRTRQPNEKPVVVFPASTVGRKGCYELREALNGLDVTLFTLGPYIESSDFWDGFDTSMGGAWLQKADLVVLPAFVEHRPRRLFMAAAAGIPVIASDECGVSNIEGIAGFPAGDVAALRSLIEKALFANADAE